MPFDVAVKALDPYGNVDTSYTGTVRWASSDTDPGVLLPADYAFQGSDSGMHTFVAGVTLTTFGDQTLTATDAADNSISGSTTIMVDPGPAAPPGGGGSRPGTRTTSADFTLIGRTRSETGIAAVDWLFASRLELPTFILDRSRA